MLGRLFLNVIRVVSPKSWPEQRRQICPVIEQSGK